LRERAVSHANFNTATYTKSDGHSYVDSNSYDYTQRYSNGHGDSYSNDYTYAATQAQRDTAAASNAGAATDAVAAWPPELNSFFQRVEDNAFHIGCERHGGSASPKTMAEESLKAQAKAKQAATMG
jgi:hypothetical protein